MLRQQKCCNQLRRPEIGPAFATSNSRSMSLLKQLEQQHSFHDDDRQQINKARQEAEALFRRKSQFSEASKPADPLPADLSPRKPRILSASAASANPATVKSPISPEPSIRPAEPGSQLAHVHRARLTSARVAILKQQHELHAKLDAIDCEMRAIDAYEAVKNGKTSSGRRARGIATTSRNARGAAAGGLRTNRRPSGR
jgi:hypothetical protein